MKPRIFTSLKTAFVFAAAFTAILFSSCVKDKSNPVCPLSDIPVNFSHSVGSVSTRAATGHPIENVPGQPDRGMIPIGFSFGIYAWHNISGAITNFASLEDNIEVTRTSSGAGGLTYSPLALWPADPSVKLGFIAYYPWTDQTAPTPNPKVDYGTGANQKITIDYTVDTNSGNHIDLMYAKTDMIQGYDPVELVFGHALARLMFKGRMEGFPAGSTVEISGIKVSKPVLKGTLEVLTPDAQPDKPEWVLSNNPLDRGDIEIPSAQISSVTLNSTLQPVIVQGGDMLVLPQSVSGLSIEVSVNYNGHPNVFTFPLDGLPAWKMNMITIYEITVTPHGIRFTVEIIDWDNEHRIDLEYVIDVTPNILSYTFDKAGGTAGQSVRVTTSQQWNFSIGGADAADFEVVRLGNELIVYPKTENYNSTSAQRTATITITAGTLVKTVFITQDGALATLDVNPPNLIFAYVANGSGSSQGVTVTTNVTAYTFNVTGANAGDFYVNYGGGGLTVYPLTANGGTTPRMAKITVTAGGLTKEVDVIHGISMSGGGGTSATTDTPYVGAFWRYNQTGERIIRITGHTGSWSAMVAWYDERWNPAGGDGIVLSATPSLDLNLGWLPSGNDNLTADMGNPVNDSYYSVSGSAIIVNGTGDIFFRIGLQQHFAAYNNVNPNYVTTFPARYAVIIITHSNGAGMQKLFLRQGEGDDYVMRPGDPNSSGAAIDDNRSFAKKWSPYNLKDPANGVPELVITAGVPNVGVALYGGVPVLYPSQAGHHFRWNYSRQAFSAYSPTIAPSGWANAQYGTGTWDASQTETCPAGYRRPTDGTTASFNTVGAVASSEARQSLWINPPTVQTHNFDNTIEGFYADGFFDRRMIVNPPNGNPTIAPLPVGMSAVSITNNNIAFWGNLFFNPTTNASLFFPSVGSRRGGFDGRLAHNGAVGAYWTSTPNSASNAWYMVFGRYSGHMGMIFNDRGNGFSIRCVRD